jgi:hypothetical protein
LPVRFRNRDDYIHLATGPRLVTPQASVLHERVGRARPAKRYLNICLKDALLQDVLGVMVIEHKQRIVSPALEAKQHREIGDHLDPLELHDVKWVSVQDTEERGAQIGRCQPVCHIWKRRRYQAKEPPWHRAAWLRHHVKALEHGSQRFSSRQAVARCKKGNEVYLVALGEAL